jgi:hypothetical protein
MATEVSTQDEQQVFRLLVRGHPRKGIAAELNLSDDAVLLEVLSIIGKLGLDREFAAAQSTSASVGAPAALAVPRQRAKDVPTHVGKPCVEERLAIASSSGRLRGGPGASSVARRDAAGDRPLGQEVKRRPDQV